MAFQMEGVFHQFSVGAGSPTVTAPGMGATVPDGCTVVVGRSHGDGSFEPTAAISFGLTENVFEGGVFARARDGLTNSSGGRGSVTDKVVHLYQDATSAAAEVEIDVTSFVAGGAQFSVTYLGGAIDSFNALVIFYAGVTAVDAQLVEVSSLAQDAGEDFTGLGSPADLVLLIGNGNNNYPNVSSSNFSFSLGAFSAARGGSQWCASWMWGNADNPQETEGWGTERYAYADIDTGGGGAIENRLEASSIATGFRLTAREAAMTSTVDLIALAIQLPATELAWCGTEDLPVSASAGSPATPQFTRAGLTADSVLAVPTRFDDVDSAASPLASKFTDERAGAFGFSFLSASEQGSLGWHAENVSPSNAQSYSQSTSLAVPDDSGDISQSGDGLLANGFTAITGGFECQVTKSPSTARKVFLLVVGSEIVITPDPVVLDLALAAPMLGFTQLPDPVALDLLAPAPTVLGETFQTPDPVVLELAVGVPFTGFIHPDPVVLQLGLPDALLVIPPVPPAPPPDLCDVYLAQALDLLPLGRAWTRDRTKVLALVLKAFAAELARVEERGRDLIEEADPRTTTELLADWERWLAIADDCAGVESTLQERRFAITTKLSAQGGQTPAFFAALAQTLGFDVEVTDIEEFQQFKAGSGRAGHALTNGTWVYVFTIHAPAWTPVFLRAGVGIAGEPLVAFGNELLECVLAKFRPAHSLVLFEFDKTYTGYAPWTLILPDPVVLELSAPVVNRLLG